LRREALSCMELTDMREREGRKLRQTVRARPVRRGHQEEPRMMIKRGGGTGCQRRAKGAKLEAFAVGQRAWIRYP
jgi:hypothetical protein